MYLMSMFMKKKKKSSASTQEIYIYMHKKLDYFNSIPFLLLSPGVFNQPSPPELSRPEGAAGIPPAIPQ